MHATTTAATSPDGLAVAASEDTALDDGADVTMVCSACGKQLAGTTASEQNWQKCSRCKRAFYCDVICQRVHWKRGGHKEACREPMACIICLDNDGPPLPIQSGCGCREEAGCAHLACRIEAAKHQGLGFHTGWHTCMTCKLPYNGAMELGLAEALWAQHRCKPPGDPHRLCAQSLRAGAYMSDSQTAKGERLFRGLFATQQRLYGADDISTLEMALNLGVTLNNQGKYTEAEALFRDTVPRMQRVLGPEDENTLHATSALAAAVGSLRKHSEAESLLRDTLAIQQRVRGDGDRRTLATCRHLAMVLANMHRNSEAEDLCRGALVHARRRLGPEHPVTLNTASVLGRALCRQQCKAVEAEASLKDTLAMQLRVLGPDNSNTRCTARYLQDLQGGWEGREAHSPAQSTETCSDGT